MNICYTAIFGDYDTLKDPAIVSEGWQYVCFTDQPLKSNVYEIRHIEPLKSRVMSRYIKLHPHRLFADHKRSIWHDGSFKVNCNLNELPKIFRIKHPYHDCAYKEIELCKKLKKDSFENLETARRELIKLGWEVMQGCYANGVLGRINEPNINAMNDTWWHYLNAFTIRDQVFSPYLYDKYKIQTELLSWEQAIKLFNFKGHKK